MTGQTSTLSNGAKVAPLLKAAPPSASPDQAALVRGRIYNRVKRTEGKLRKLPHFEEVLKGATGERIAPEHHPPPLQSGGSEGRGELISRVCQRGKKTTVGDIYGLPSPERRRVPGYQAPPSPGFRGSPGGLTATSKPVYL